MVLVLPLLALVLGSLIPAFGVKLSASSLTFANYAYVLFGHEAARRALGNSLFLSAFAAVVVVVLSLPLAQALARGRSRTLSVLGAFVDLPYALPGVVLSIAMILLFLRPLPLVNLSLYNTLGILMIAYVSRFFSLGLRPLAAAFRQLDRTLDEAAAVAGAKPARRFRKIAVPLVFPTACASALMVFLTAFCELTVSALLWSTGNETLGVVVFSFEQGGDATLASALSVLVFLVTLGLMGLADRLGKNLPPGALPWRD
jgi:iron(III) transport system permease protein